MNKKILSLVMAACLTVGSSTMALAAPKAPTCDNENCIVHVKGSANKKNDLLSAEMKLINKINSNRQWNDAAVLSEQIGPRVSTTAEEYQGAQYIQSQFQQAGLDATIESFQVVGSATVEVKEGDKVFNARSFKNSAPCEAVTAELVDCGLGYPEDFEGAQGKIALVKRGTLTYAAKLNNATAAGVAAIVMYNNSGTSAVSSTAPAGCAPVAGLTLADGEALAARLAAGESISLSVKVNEPPVNDSWNVVATRKPDGKKDKNDSNEIVLVTAHMDSVPLAPGANDNASGVVCMLEVARAMKNLDIDREVRFIACGSEEVGLLGSKAYVNTLTQDELSRIVGAFNMDMVATGYGPCTEMAVLSLDGQENDMTKLLTAAGQKLACLTTEEVDYNGDFDGRMGSSDHVSLESVGIKTALISNVDPEKKSNIFSAIEPYYHTPEDAMYNLSQPRLERTAKLFGLALYASLNK